MIRELASAWWSWMAPMSAQLGVVSLAVLGADALVGRWAWPQQRASLWWLVLLKMTLPPVLASPVSLVRILPSPAAAGARLAAADDASGWVPGLFLAWLAGAAALGIWGASRTRRTLRRIDGESRGDLPASLGPVLRACAARLGMSRLPRVDVSRAVRSPAVAGLIRPRLILPEEAIRGEEGSRLEHVLLHELAHIRRRDPLAGALVLALQVTYWFHPAAWLAGSRLASLREKACDRVVARCLGGSTAGYCGTLARFALRSAGAAAPGGLAFVRPRRAVLDRIAALQGFDGSRAAGRRAGTAAAAALILACFVPLGSPEPPAADGSAFAHLAPGGCLARRYQVLMLLAREEAGETAPGPSETQPTERGARP